MAALVLAAIGATCCTRATVDSPDRNVAVDAEASPGSTRIRESDCVPTDGFYELVPSMRGGWPDEDCLDRFDVEIRGEMLDGTIVSEGEAVPWPHLANGKVSPATTWCIQFDAPLATGSYGTFWSRAYVHLARTAGDGYEGLVIWDHYGSRADHYVLRRIGP